MKLAFCLFRYFPFGGLQRDFLRIAHECIKRGFTVDVYTSKWEGPRDPHLSVTVIPPTGWQNHSRMASFVKRLQPYLREEHYDLVVGFNKMPGLDVYYAADTCFQAKARLLHGAWYRLMPRYRHWVTYEKAVFTKESKTAILLISKNQQADFMQYYGTNPERFYLLPPGIAKDRMAPDNADEIRLKTREEFHVRDDELLLLLVGSGFKTKGLDRILRGIAALPTDVKNRTRLFIIGDDHQSVFERQASKLQIREHIFFMGGRKDVPRFLLAANLLLHPAYNENTGTVLLEAIAAGLPVLTTDVCGYADYIRSANAGVVLSSPFQQTEFNQTLQEMLRSPKQMEWRQNGLGFAKTADIYSMPERAVDRIEWLYANARS